MDVDRKNQDCPCGSGLRYNECCGCEVRLAAAVCIDETGRVASGQLTPELRQALEAAQSPSLFPARIDFATGRVTLVKMSPQWYEQSVFLDAARIRGQCSIEMDVRSFARWCDELDWRPTPYIFHSAFCGSTLMSQALAAGFDSLPLREPDVMGNVMFNFRDIESASRRQWLGRVMRMLARRFRADQQAVVKTNDYANRFLLEVAGCYDEFPILYMYTDLADFVAACLKAENRLPWIEERCSLVGDCAERLLNFSPPTKSARVDYVYMAALYWSVNVALYLEAQRRMPRRLRCLDLDQLLAAPAEVVAACAEFFGLTVRGDIDMPAALDSVFNVYSKNAQFRYTPEQRQAEQAQLRERFESQIVKAEQLARGWLGDDYPPGHMPGALEAN